VPLLTRAPATTPLIPNLATPSLPSPSQPYLPTPPPSPMSRSVRLCSSSGASSHQSTY
jgi:hypothetical protein